MLTYNFDNVKIPLYEYIYNCIKNDILARKLKAGQKLPSKRTFAENNGISTITVQNAYDQLISEGYIYTVPRKGYYVANLYGLSTVNKETNISLNIRLPKEKRTDLIDLSDNRMNTDNFPFSIWAKLSRSILSGKSRELMEISPTNGKKELREAIAGHLKSFRGMLVDPNQIVVGAGTEYLYSLLIQLLGNDKMYCLENPGYTKIAKVYTKHQVTCHYVDLDDSGITLKGLRKAEADVVHISPNHHFPTGITMPVKRRYEVLSWANEKDGRYIIEDDYDSEFRISGKPIPTLFSIDESEKVIYMNTFSKSLTPTIRISYMVLPVHLANLFYESLSFYACTVSNFEQFILADFIKNGYFEKHINRMRLFYARKRRALIDAVKNSRLKDISEIIESDSGLHFLLKIDTEKTDADFSAQLQDKGIHVEFLSEFYHDKSNREHLMIINYSNFDVQTMGDIFDKIAEIAEK